MYETNGRHTSNSQHINEPFSIVFHGKLQSCISHKFGIYVHCRLNVQSLRVCDSIKCKAIVCVMIHSFGCCRNVFFYVVTCSAKHDILSIFWLWQCLKVGSLCGYMNSLTNFVCVSFFSSFSENMAF